MNRFKKIHKTRERRKSKVRSLIQGSAKKPRLSVFRSNKNIYAQLIDDEAARTLVAASSRISEIKAKKSVKAEEVGKTLAEKARKLGVETATFDRGRYKYHGRVKAVAEGARKAGLKI